jgi:hypothetical protein
LVILLSSLKAVFKAVLPLEVASVVLENVYAPWKYPAFQRRDSVAWKEW